MADDAPPPPGPPEHPQYPVQPVHPPYPVPPPYPPYQPPGYPAYPPQHPVQLPPQYPAQQWAPYPPPYLAHAGYPAPRLVPAKPTFPHDRPRPYHQMLRTWTYAWWRSVVGIVLVLAGFLIIAPTLALPILVVDALLRPGAFLDNFQQATTLDVVTPAAMLYLNVSLGGAILVTWAAISVHGLKPRWLASVKPRIRWKFLAVCLGLSVVALVVSLVVAAVLPGGSEDSGVGGKLNDFTTTSAWLALIVLLTTPFQAAGEEYVFRGYLLQAVGSFVEKPWWRWFTILFTAFLFACAHLQFSPPVFFDRFAFGVVAAWVAIRTGGLEAGIALHVLNNYLAFGLALAFGDISASLNSPEASWWNIFSTLAQSLTYAALVYVVATKMGLRNTTQPPDPPGQPVQLAATG